MKKFCLFLICTFILYADGERTTVMATPTVYKVTITNPQFKKADGTYVTFISGTYTFDIASVSPFQEVGTIGAGVVLEPGLYTEFRAEINHAFGLKAAATGPLGENIHTATYSASVDITTPEGKVYNNVPLASSTSGEAATEQSIPIPTGTDIEAEMAAHDGELLPNGNIRIHKNITLNIPSSDNFKGVRWSFNVTNCAQFDQMPPNDPQHPNAWTIILHPPNATFEVVQ